MRILLVDNHDSFTFNLAHDIARVTGAMPDVIANDAPLSSSVHDVLAGYDAVVVSPGPGTPDRPDDLGHSGAIVAQGQVPVLGVCLGMQAIAHAYGASVERAPRPVHGEIGEVAHDGTGLFTGLPNPLSMVRYHSLVVTGLPADLVVDATCEGLVMALHHRDRPLWGVQTHPESICSQHGRDLLGTFFDLAREWNDRARRIRQSPAPVASPRATDADGATEVRPTRGRRVLAREVACEATGENVFDALFRGQEHSWWLDSATSPGSGGVSACGSAEGPLARIVSLSDVLTIRDGSGMHTSSCDLLDLVGADQGALVPASGGEQDGVREYVWVPTDSVSSEYEGVLQGGRGGTPSTGDARGLRASPSLPFVPGWVGYLGYEYAAARLPDATVLDDPHDPSHEALAPQSIPDDPRAVLVFTDRLVALDHAGSAWAIAIADDTCADLQLAWLERTARRLQRLSRTEAPPPAEAAPDVRDVSIRHDRAAYLDLIDRCREQIAAGESYELCLTNRIEVHAAIDSWDLYRRLRATSPRPFAAYLGFGDTHVLSASPERFLRVDPAPSGTRVQAKPIKGTRPRGRTPDEDARLAAELADDVKERAENLMIVDLLRHDLSRVCRPGSVEVPLLFDVETHAGVHQLVSTIVGELDAGRTGIDVVRAALPGGSMTGAPKERSVRILRDLEGGPRGVYSGVLGYFSIDGTIDLSIVIRTVVHHPDRLTYGVGGAITARSDPRAEWLETLVKAGTLGRALGLDLDAILDVGE